MSVEFSPAFIGIEGLTCPAYNEAAFRYFLDIERKRAERTTRPLLLVFVRLRGGDDAAAPVFPRVFAALAASLREADFVGWYRHGVVAAAVLALGAPVADNVPQRVRERIGRSLSRTLTRDEYSRVHLRAIVIGGAPRN